MRIKIIGDNNCARATRHLLRMAGFAVTDFLPAEAITQAPHSGFAITIELAPALHPLILPTAPELPTHVHNASGNGEASAEVPDRGARAGVSSPSHATQTKTKGAQAEDGKTKGAQAEAYATGGGPAGFGSVDFSLRGVGKEKTKSARGEGCSSQEETKGAQAEAYATGGGIYFDSAYGALEAAVLRHVTQLSARPVMVDRPGGKVHSERELRIVIRQCGDAQANEAAAVAVEFGVLRGLLDLVTPPPSTVAGKPVLSLFEAAEKSAEAPGNAGVAAKPAGASRRKWWRLGLLLLAGPLLTITGRVQAAPRHVVEERGVDGAYLHLEAELAPAAQGQFADGQMNIALIGGAAVSGSLYDSDNTALKVNCVVGCGSSAGFSDNTAFSAGSTSVNNISAVFNDSIAALTSGDAGALRSTSDRMLYINVGKLGGTSLSGANVVDSGNTAFRINCVVGCSASAGFTDNSAFTAGTTAESNVGGVFNDGLTALSSGNAAAARITSSRALHINLRNSSGTEIGTAASPVRIDPVGTTTQPVSWSSQSVSLTGTLPAFASTPAVSCTAANCSVNLANWGGTALGTPTNFGTTPGAVASGSVNASLFVGTVAAASGNGTSGTGNQRVNIASDNSADANWGQGATGSAVPSGAQYVGGNGSGNLTGIIACDNSTAVNMSTATTTQIVAISGTAGRTYICSIDLVAGAADNVALISGSGSNCASNQAGLAGGTTAATGWNFAANGGLTKGSGLGMIYKTAATNNEICLVTSAAAQLSGSITWTQF